MPASALLTIADGPELDQLVAGMGDELDRTHPDGVVLVGLLKGSVCLLADLGRRLSVPVEIDFLAIAPYAPDSGRVRLVKDLDSDVSGRPVVLVTDIVDTGLTLQYLRRELEARGPASLAVATLVDKRARRIVPVEIEVVGIEVPDVFVIGYGLDFAGRYRNLHGLWGADAAALAAEPDRHVLELYTASHIGPPAAPNAPRSRSAP